MNVKIEKSEIYGTVRAVCSKSVAHRLLICSALGALCGAKTEILGITENEDILATISCLSALNAVAHKHSIKNTPDNGLVRGDENIFTISQNKEGGGGEQSINCGESGSTLRFLLPILGALGVTATVECKEGLAKRPIAELVKTLREGGCAISSNSLPMKISGRLQSGEYRIAGGISSQYISGLIMALPLLIGDSKIIIEGETASEPYIEITRFVMAEFGVKTQKTAYGYEVFGGQKYKSLGQYTVDGDWSNAAFWLVAGAIGGDITVKGILKKSPQGDKAITDILKSLGAEIIQTDSAVTVKKSTLAGAEIDCRNTPDLIPIVSLAAALAVGNSSIIGVDRLRYKESDRLAAIMDILGKLGINCRYEKDTLFIEGGKIHSAEIDCRGDHRLVMTGAIAGTVCGATLIGAEAARKSYPTFFEDLSMLCGKYLELK